MELLHLLKCLNEWKWQMQIFWRWQFKYRIKFKTDSSQWQLEPIVNAWFFDQQKWSRWNQGLQFEYWGFGNILKRFYCKLLLNWRIYDAANVAMFRFSPPGSRVSCRQKHRSAHSCDQQLQIWEYIDENTTVYADYSQNQEKVDSCLSITH